MAMVNDIELWLIEIEIFMGVITKPITSGKANKEETPSTEAHYQFQLKNVPLKSWEQGLLIQPSAQALIWQPNTSFRDTGK